MWKESMLKVHTNCPECYAVIMALGYTSQFPTFFVRPISSSLKIEILIKMKIA